LFPQGLKPQVAVGSSLRDFDDFREGRWKINRDKVVCGDFFIMLIFNNIRINGVKKVGTRHQNGDNCCGRAMFFFIFAHVKDLSL
jgi:hypothetical protein